MTTKPPEYSRLIHSVAKQIESTPDGLMDFRNICREHRYVRAFDLKEKRACEVIQSLQRRMIVHPGRYEKFVEILEIIEREDVIKMLPGYQDCQSKDAGNNNTKPLHNTTGIAETDDTTSSTSQSANDVAGNKKTKPLYHTKGTPKKDDVTPSTSQTTGEVADGVTDIELLKLSDNIQPERVRHLGIYLSIPYSEIQTKLMQRHDGGTLSLLIHWRENVPGRDQRQQLLQALEQAGMNDLVSACFGEGENCSHEDAGPLSRSSMISEKTLSKLAGKIGEGWSQFGIQHLGMVKVDIDRFKDNELSMENKIFKMLYEWRRRYHTDATIGKLVDLMEDSKDISPDSFSFIIEELHSTE